jgi:hypothetical protein
MSTEEVRVPVLPGADSFATECIINGGFVVYEEVVHIDNSEELHQE